MLVWITDAWHQLRAIPAGNTGGRAEAAAATLAILHNDRMPQAAAAMAASYCEGALAELERVFTAARATIASETTAGAGASTSTSGNGNGNGAGRAGGGVATGGAGGALSRAVKVVAAACRRLEAAVEVH